MKLREHPFSVVREFHLVDALRWVRFAIPESSHGRQPRHGREIRRAPLSLPHDKNSFNATRPIVDDPCQSPSPLQKTGPLSYGNSPALCALRRFRLSLRRQSSKNRR